MINHCAYLLVVHGSRQLTYQQSVENLTNLIRNNLLSQKLPVKLDTAYLELSEQSLGEKIASFAQDCIINNYQKLKILPLFLLSGTHVKQDIPEEITRAKQLLEQANININIELLPYLGKEQKLIKLLENKYQKHPADCRVIIAHGTSLTEGNQECEQLALSLNAHLAYWSKQPFLKELLPTLVNNNYQNIAILPYFLFTGKISVAISEKVNQLQLEYPENKLFYIEPLGVTEELASIITEILCND